MKYIKSFLLFTSLFSFSCLNVCHSQPTTDAIVCKNGLCGVVNDKDQSIVIPLEYDEIRRCVNYKYTWSFENIPSRFFWVRKHGDWALFNAGKQLTDFKFINHFNLVEGLIPVQTFEDTWGAIDSTGKYVIPLEYKRVKMLRGGICAVQNKEYRMGLLDKEGKVVVPIRYDNIVDAGNLCALWNKGSVDLFVIPKRKFLPGSFSVFEKPGGGNLFDITGENRDIFVVKQNKKYGYLDPQGNFILKPTYDSVKPFSEGLAAVKVGKRWGFVNGTGKIKLKPLYEDAESFSEGTAGVKIDGKWGFIDKTGNVIVPAVYDSIDGGFYRGTVTVSKGSKKYTLKKKNDKVTETEGEMDRSETIRVDAFESRQ